MSDASSQTDSVNQRVSPIESTGRAWQVAIRPAHFDTRELRDLLQRGFRTWVDDDGEFDDDAFAADVGSYTTTAMYDPPRDEVLSDPLVSPANPGRLAVLTAVGTMLILENDRLKQADRAVVLHHPLRNFYAHHVVTALATQDEEWTEFLEIELAEAVYRFWDELETVPPGRAVTGIRTFERGTVDRYIEIPFRHAHWKQLVSDSSRDDDWDLRCFVDDNCLYIPIDDLFDQVVSYVTGQDGAVATLCEAFAAVVSEERLNQLQRDIDAVDKEISRILHSGGEDRVFRDRRYEGKHYTILQAATESEEISLGEWHTARQYYQVLNDYATETDSGWQKSVIAQFNAPRDVASYLRSIRDHEDVSVKQQSGANKYRLQSSQGYEEVPIDTIDDFLEFPCLRNIHEANLNGHPDRYRNYTFVRTILANATEFSLEEIVDWYRQYPWFDEQITREQVGYEMAQEEKPDGPPMPVSCNNENPDWQQYCIGRENCPYNLYRSTQHRPYVTEELDDGTESNPFGSSE